MLPAMFESLGIGDSGCAAKRLHWKKVLWQRKQPGAQLHASQSFKNSFNQLLRSNSQLYHGIARDCHLPLVVSYSPRISAIVIKDIFSTV